jgi:hypothetical protein
MNEAETRAEHIAPALKAEFEVSEKIGVKKGVCGAIAVQNRENGRFLRLFHDYVGKSVN